MAFPAVAMRGLVDPAVGEAEREGVRFGLGRVVPAGLAGGGEWEGELRPCSGRQGRGGEHRGAESLACEAEADAVDRVEVGNDEVVDVWGKGHKCGLA